MRKLLVVLGFVCLLLFVHNRLGLAETLNNIDLMRQFFVDLGFWGYLAFIVVSVLVAVCLLPGQFLAIIAGVTYGWFLGGILTVIGATIGSTVSFVIGKYLAREYVVKRFGQTVIFQKIEKGVEENGISFLILTRLVPVFPYALQSYAYALTPMKTGVFTLVSLLTMIPASFIYAYMSAEIATGGFSFKLLLEFALAGVVLFIISFIPRRIAERNNISLEVKKVNSGLAP